MNRIIAQYYPNFSQYQSLRNQMVDLLEDHDLDFRLSPVLPSFGMLCREIGEIEHSYIASFSQLTQDFNWRNDDPTIEQSVEKLRNWYADLDGQLREVIESMSDADLDEKKIDRGGGFILPPHIQLEVYKEALLIFYGKAYIYLKAMGKELPQQWAEWIG
ncbi:MAG: DinB family protein [Candidatus Kapaibacterium sp.]